LKIEDWLHAPILDIAQFFPMKSRRIGEFGYQDRKEREMDLFMSDEIECQD